MTATEAPGGNLGPSSRRLAPIGRRVFSREEYALLALPLSMLAVLLVLALTLGVPPAG